MLLELNVLNHQFTVTLLLHFAQLSNFFLARQRHKSPIILIVFRLVVSNVTQNLVFFPCFFEAFVVGNIFGISFQLFFKECFFRGITLSCKINWPHWKEVNKIYYIIFVWNHFGIRLCGRSWPKTSMAQIITFLCKAILLYMTHLCL